MNTLENCAYQLEDNWAKLPARYQDAAKSLVQAFRTKRNFSDKQASFLQSLAGMLNKPAATAEVPKNKFPNIIALFNQASKNLKQPKIRLELGKKKIVLSVAGPTSKFPGSVNVTDGGPFGNNVYYGRVNLDGGFDQRQDLPGLINLLQSLQGDALQLAKDYGRRTGNCCMCGRRLTDPVSVANGIGPICEDNFFGG